MSNCKQCGADLNDAKFCPNCGSATSGDLVEQKMSSTPVGADVRQRSLNDMQHMLNYFGAKQALYDEFDKISEEIEDRASRGYFGWIGGVVAAVLLGLLSKAAFFYILAAGFVALFILFKKKNKDKLNAAVAKRDEIGTELGAYYDAYGYCAIGIEYTKPSTLNSLFELIRKGRASTPGDAINIYLADIEQAEIHRLQAEATEAAKETARNTKQAAKHAKKAASYSSASFWFK